MAILSGQVLINNVDIYDKYGAYLCEERRGDRKNLEAIFTPSSTKSHVAINYREVKGEKYSDKLSVVNEARDVELTFCIVAPTKSEWIAKYTDFIAFLKSGDVTIQGNGNDIDDEVIEGYGWLNVEFPTLNHELKMFYKSCTSYSQLTYLWNEGKQASHFKVNFREPKPAL